MERVSVDKILEVMHDLAKVQRRDGDRGEVHYAVCQVCGYSLFQFSYPDNPPAIRVEPMHNSTENCPKCHEIAQRYPELAAWLARVLYIRDRTR